MNYLLDSNIYIYIYIYIYILWIHDTIYYCMSNALQFYYIYSYIQLHHKIMWLQLWVVFIRVVNKTELIHYELKLCNSIYYDPEPELILLYFDTEPNWYFDILKWRTRTRTDTFAHLYKLNNIF